MKVFTVDIRCHALLNEIFNEQKRGVEIGVWKGNLSWRLLASNKNIFLYMVDPWKASEEGDSYLNTDDTIAFYTQKQHDEAMQMAIDAVNQFRDRCEILRMTSLEAAKRFDDLSLDFVFIDGDHSYEGCSLDISLWYPKLKVGGLLSGHDYVDEKGYGVIQAVDEFIASIGGQLRLGGNNTWFVTKQ